MTFVYILVALIILLLMIVIHELGHYVAGKIFKFKINEFSIGFGPTIFTRTSKKTGEKFSLRLIPLGGYCAFEDEDGLETEKEDEQADFVNPDEVFPEITPKPIMPPVVDPLERSEEKPRSFTEEKPWKRIIVLVSGALFNFISAVLFSFIFIWTMGYSVPKVDALYTDESGAAYATELCVGDTILAVDGEKITVMKSYDDLVKDKTVGKKYLLTVDRGGEIVEVTVEVKRIINRNYTAPDGTVSDLDYAGFGFQSMTTSRDGKFIDALKYSIPYTCKLAFLVLATLGGLFTGSVPLTSVTGPVGTIGFMAELGMYDVRNFIVLLPLIAANLAIFNVLPIPALDGSKIVFTAIEWVRGKPLNRKVESIIHAVGIILLLAFVVVIDIVGILT